MSTNPTSRTRQMGLQRRGPWSPQEDACLLASVAIHGPINWVKIGDDVVTRCAKQCRERYHQNLDPRLKKTPITDEEGAKILEYHAEMGPKWADIARKLGRRSDNQVKNWYNGGKNKRNRQNRDRQDRDRRNQKLAYRNSHGPHDAYSNFQGNPNQMPGAPFMGDLPPFYQPQPQPTTHQPQPYIPSSFQQGYLGHMYTNPPQQHLQLPSPVDTEAPRSYNGFGGPQYAANQNDFNSSSSRLPMIAPVESHHHEMPEPVESHHHEIPEPVESHYHGQLPSPAESYHRGQRGTVPLHHMLNPVTYN